MKMDAAFTYRKHLQPADELRNGRRGCGYYKGIGDLESPNPTDRYSVDSSRDIRTGIALGSRSIRFHDYENKSGRIRGARASAFMVAVPALVELGDRQ